MRSSRAGLHRRRAAARVRRASWLRLASWLRGNRRRRGHGSRPPPGGTRDAETEQHATWPNQAPEPAPAQQRRAAGWAAAALRLFGAIAVTVSLAAGIFGIGYFLRHSRSFAITHIRVPRMEHVSEETLRQRIAVTPGTNLFSVDLEEVQRRIAAEPWIKFARVRRELPSTLAIDLTEHEASALLALGHSLYLMDSSGHVFKRASATEGAGLPVLTGVARETYLSDREEALRQIEEALVAYAAYQGRSAERPEAIPSRPPLGEIHIDLFSGLTLYTASGVALRLGRGDAAEFAGRLRRFDAVWGALTQARLRPQVIFLDNRAHPDHVTVRLRESG